MSYTPSYSKPTWVNGTVPAINKTNLQAISDTLESLENALQTDSAQVDQNTSDILDLQTNKQDVLSFDATPTENSTNPVTSDGIYDALATKQDTLSFDATPTENSTNPVTSNGIYDALLSLLPTDTVTDDVITITDGFNANAIDYSTTFEPVQDLNGYDHPWVGGAGKNKLPLVLDDIKSANTSGTWSGNAYTINDVTFTVNTNDGGNVTSITVNGTASANIVFYVFTNFTTQNGNILNGTPANGGANKYRMRIEGASSPWTSFAVDDGSGATISGYSGEVVDCYIGVYSGYSASNLVFYPMVRLSSESDATFEPYSNICPMSGYTDVNVTRTGKNLINTNDINKGYYNDINFTNTNPTSNVFRCFHLFLKAGQYTVSWGKSVKIIRLVADDVFSEVNIENRTTYTFTITKDGQFGISWRDNTSGTTVWDDTTPVQLEVGSTATDYEAYNGTSVTVDLNGTRYGGTLDMTTGELSLTMANIASYNGETINEPWLSSMDEYVTGTTPTTGAQVVYTLSSPTTVTLTANDLSLLRGNNTVWSDCGTSTLTYYCDIAKYIAKQ